jgi:hypothetical protein
LTAMREELGQLEPRAIAETEADKITVKAKGGNGPVANLAFQFAADATLDGIGVEIGN